MQGTEEAGSAHVVAQRLARRLQEAVDRHAGLFASSTAEEGDAEPNPLFVRQSARDLLDTVVSVLREADDEFIRKESCGTGPSIALLLNDLDGPIDDAMEAVAARLGLGDPRIRSALLGLLADLKSSETIRVALELLPCALPPPPADCDHSRDKPKKKQKQQKRSTKQKNDPEFELRLEQASGQVVECLQSLARRHPPSVPRILDCLGSVTLHESFRSAPFRMALDSLPGAVRDASTSVTASDASFGALNSVLLTLLSSVRSEEDGLVAWEAIRKEWESLEDECDDEEERASATAVRGDRRPSRENLGCVAQLMMGAVSSSLLASCSRGRNRSGCGDVLALSFLRPLLDDAREAMYDHQDEERARSPDPRHEITWEDMLVGDWVGLLVLSQVPHLADSVDQVLDAWIARSQGGEATMRRPLKVLMGWMGRGSGRETSHTSGALYLRLAPALLRCAVFSLLAPARIATDPSMQEEIQAFVVLLHECLDSDRQAELVQCMIHLIDEVSSWEVLVDEGSHRRSSGSSKRRPRAEMGSRSKERTVDDVRSAQQTVRRLVNSVLASLIETSPTALVGLKEVLVRQLTQASSLESSSARKQEDESIDDVCRIVARLAATGESAASCDGMSSADVVPLVQELLFDSSTSTSMTTPNMSLQWKAPTQMAHRGIQLATELILSSALSPENEALIRNRVVELLLPPTRRMVDPRLGGYGLAFLRALLTRDEPSSSSGVVFRHLKDLLSNTGLVQLLHNYQSTSQTIINSALAYRDVPLEFMSQRSDADHARDMVFCIGYFLKRCDRWHPSTWEETTIWVYELVNLYLRLGRERATKGWKSQGWLVAPIELPVLRFPSHESDALTIVETELSRFDVSSELARTSDLPLEAAAAAAAELDVRKTVDTIVCFTLSMWVALGLSAAVLQNSYENISEQTRTEQPCAKRQTTQLLHFHLLKLQSIRVRLRVVGRLFSHIQATLARRQSRKAGNAGHDLNLGLSTVKEAVLTSMHLDRLFDQNRLIRFDFLLDFFCSDVGGDVRGALTNFATRTTVLEGSLARDFRCMRLKTVLAEQAASILESASSGDSMTDVQESSITYCLRLMKFLTGVLPRLRKGYFARFRQIREDGFSMEAILSFSVAVSSVLTSLILKWSPSEEAKDRNGASSLSEYGPDRYWFLEVTWVEGTTKSGRRDDVLFSYVREMLDECDCLPIAVSLVDILTTFAVDGHLRLLDEVVSSSRLALKTIYADVEHLGSPAPPFILTYLLRKKKPGLAHRELLFEKSMGRLCRQCRENRPGFSLYRVLIIQHFCVLALSGDLLAQNVEFIAYLVQELDGRYRMPLDHKSCGDEKKDPDVECKAANHVETSLPFLSVDFFEQFYEYLLFALVGVVAICPPCTLKTAGVSLGPYVHICGLLQLLRRLLLVYKEHFVAFSRKSAAFMYDGLQLALAASRNKVQECVTWRNNQPFPQPGSSTAEVAYDQGSTVFLKRLLDVARAVTAAVLDVCEVWQNQRDDLSLKSRSTRLQELANNTITSLNHVASTHNWPPPENNVAASFDEVVPVQRGSCRENVLTGADARNGVGFDECAVDDEGSDEESFCATGNWG